MPASEVIVGEQAKALFITLYAIFSSDGKVTESANVNGGTFTLTTAGKEGGVSCTRNNSSQYKCTVK